MRTTLVELRAQNGSVPHCAIDRLHPDRACSEILAHVRKHQSL